jgi:hypothetical protein
MAAEILKISIDLGNGQVEDVIIRDHDSPSNLAKQFCLRHSLNQKMFEILSEQFRVKKESIMR